MTSSDQQTLLVWSHAGLSSNTVDSPTTHAPLPSAESLSSPTEEEEEEEEGEDFSSSAPPEDDAATQGPRRSARVRGAQPYQHLVGKMVGNSPGYGTLYGDPNSGVEMKFTDDELGWAGFATREFRCDEKVTPYAGKIGNRRRDLLSDLSPETAQQDSHTVHVAQGLVIEGVREPTRGYGLGSLLNSSNTATCNLKTSLPDEKNPLPQAWVQTRRKVKKGEEFDINYAVL
jgi:hypothetical protein